jgi:hypothetical protein
VNAEPLPRSMTLAMSLRSTTTAHMDGEWLLLLREALARGERFRWFLQGTSMHPTLPSGCRVEIAALRGQPRLGDIIVFSFEKELVAHRLVQRSGDQWVTQGDGRLGPDRPVDSSQVLGIVIAAFSTDGQPCWPGRFPRAEAHLWIARHHALRIPRRIHEWVRQLPWRAPA